MGYAGLLLTFSGWAVLVVALAALPAFVAEARFARSAFRLFSWRAPETRQQNYLETVLAREDYAKEVKIYGLGERLLTRYRQIFKGLYAEDKRLTLRRGGWGYALGLVSTAAFYGAYTWIAWAAMAREISLGAMTMYLVVFRQGQSVFTALLAAVGGMYEDNLYGHPHLPPLLHGADGRSHRRARWRASARARRSQTAHGRERHLRPAVLPPGRGLSVGPTARPRRRGRSRGAS